MTKKEQLTLERELFKLKRSLGGIRHMRGLPDVLFVIDVGQEHLAIKEAQRLNIPVVGVVDTNGSIDGVDYIIPGNDDAIRAITLYVRSIADAIINAKDAALIKHEDDSVEVDDSAKADPKSVDAAVQPKKDDKEESASA